MNKNFRLTIIGCSIFIAGILSGNAIAAQTHMQNAAAALNNAIAELDEAEHNKGGHRERAIGLAQQALDEVQAGIDAGRQ